MCLKLYFKEENSDIFYKKYILYKEKYLNLKNKLLVEQVGGSSNLINIVSFNVLNESQDISFMTFKNYSEYIKEIKLIDKPTNKNLKNLLWSLTKIEKKEWALFRKYKLLGIIQYYLSQNYICCLQEVSDNLLQEINKKYGKQYIVVSTFDPTNPKEIEYRVTIFPLNYQIKNSSNILFDGPNIKRKDGLFTLVSDGSKEFILINLHFYWKSNDTNYKDFANKILDKISQYNLPLIICGDFNLNIEHPFMKTFIQVLKTKIDIQLNNQNYSNNFTSYNTRTNELGWIDHILTWGFEVTQSTNTTNNINNYEIFYNVKKILDELLVFKDNLDDKNNKQIIEIFNNNKWISDHKPVLISLKYLK